MLVRQYCATETTINCTKSTLYSSTLFVREVIAGRNNFEFVTRSVPKRPRVDTTCLAIAGNEKRARPLLFNDATRARPCLFKRRHAISPPQRNENDMHMKAATVAKSIIDHKFPLRSIACHFLAALPFPLFG